MVSTILQDPAAHWRKSTTRKARAPAFRKPSLRGLTRRALPRLRPKAEFRPFRKSLGFLLQSCILRSCNAGLHAILGHIGTPLAGAAVTSQGSATLEPRAASAPGSSCDNQKGFSAGEACSIQHCRNLRSRLHASFNASRDMQKQDGSCG